MTDRWSDLSQRARSYHEAQQTEAALTQQQRHHERQALIARGRELLAIEREEDRKLLDASELGTALEIVGRDVWGEGTIVPLKKSVGIRLISADYPTLFRDDTDHSILRQGTDASRITLRVERDLVTGTPHFKLSYTGINTARAKEEIGPLRDFFKERSAFYGVWRIDSLLLPITANADPVSSKQPHAADTIVASLVNMTQFAIRRGALPQDARRFTSELVAKLPQRTKNPTNAWSEEELAIWSQGESLPHRVLHFITRKK